MAEKTQSKINTKIAVIVSVFALLICTVAGALFSLNIVFRKDHLSEIIVQYYEEDEPEEVKNVFNLLDSTDFNAISDALADGSAVSTLASLPGLEGLTKISEASSIFDSLGGFGSMFSGVASIFKIVKGNNTVVSVVLDAVDANTLVTAETISGALKAAGVPASDPEEDDAKVSAFLRTRLSAELTVSMAYRYYDYYAGRGDDTEALYEELCATIKSRPQDMSILFSSTVSELDGNMTDRFVGMLAKALIDTSTPPREKEISPGAHTVLGMLFSFKMAIVWLFVGCLNFALVWLLTRDGRSALRHWGVSFIFCGIVVAALYFLNKRIIGGFFSSSRYILLKYAFPIVGAIFVIFAIIILIAASLRLGASNKKELTKFDPQSNVLTASDIEIIQKFGLSDLVMSNEVEKKRRPDGTVDYYGDGRGLEAQREFLRKQKEREEAKKKAASDRLRGIMPDRPQDGTTLNGESVPPKDESGKS